MAWKKLGFVYGPDGSSGWAQHSALTPTPLLIDSERIRVFTGFRDGEGVSRIGFVDVEAGDPRRVISVSKEPVLDIGRPGAFDDNGVILGDVVRTEAGIRMYYVGFQKVQKAKFLAFTGAAISRDGGSSFVRESEAPVLDRSDEGLYFRAIHSAAFEDGRWRIWYAAGSLWSIINGVPYPNYHVRYIESDDGLRFGPEGVACITHVGDEYRIGRPRVIATRRGYEMYYTKGTLAGEYLPGYAVSGDGVNWKRFDDQVGIGVSAEGWDSRTLCYMSPIACGDRVYVFYNGNDMGRAGFGCARLEW